MKQMEYTVKIVTNGTIDSKELADALADNGADFAADIAKVEVVNFRVLPQPREKAAAKS